MGCIQTGTTGLKQSALRAVHGGWDYNTGWGHQSLRRRFREEAGVRNNLLSGLDRDGWRSFRIAFCSIQLIRYYISGALLHPRVSGWDLEEGLIERTIGE